MKNVEFLKTLSAFLIGGVAGALILEDGVDWVETTYPSLTDYGLYLFFGLVVITIAIYAYAIARLIRQVINRSRLSILVYLLDEENRLLLIKHPYHGVRLPVGGRLETHAKVHEAVAERLESEAGVKEFEFVDAFHEPIVRVSEKVTQVPAPTAAHVETRRQRGGVSQHYALVYVCRLKSGNRTPASLKYDPQWFTYNEMNLLDEAERPYDDIFRRYAFIWNKLHPKSKHISMSEGL